MPHTTLNDKTWLEIARYTLIKDRRLLGVGVVHQTELPQLRLPMYNLLEGMEEINSNIYKYILN